MDATHYPSPRCAFHCRRRVHTVAGSRLAASRRAVQRVAVAALVTLAVLEASVRAQTVGPVRRRSRAQHCVGAQRRQMLSPATRKRTVGSPRTKQCRLARRRESHLPLLCLAPSFRSAVLWSTLSAKMTNTPGPSGPLNRPVAPPSSWLQLQWRGQGEGVEYALWAKVYVMVSTHRRKEGDGGYGNWL